MAQRIHSPDLTRRAFAVDQAFLALGHRTFDAEGARFVRAPEYPTVHDANHVHAVRAATPEAIVRLLERADREFAHCRHRLVRLDADTPPVVEAMLVVRGYRREATVLLLLEGDLSGDAPAHEISPIEDEAGWQAHARLKQADWDEVAASKGLRDVAHVGAQMARVDRAKSPPATWWLAYVDGTPCGYVASFPGDDGVGQVDDLYVVPALRRRGVATALIHRAVASCRAAGAGPVVIAADVDDTPKQMYVALGFRPVGVAQKYTLRLSG